MSRERIASLAGQRDVTELAPEACPPGSPSFETVYRDARAGMVHVAFLIVGSQAVAEELVQEAFVRLHRHFDRVDNPGGFLRTTVVRLCLTWRTRADTEARGLTLLGEPGPIGEPELDTTWDALATLRPERRAVLVLRYYADMTPNEIADVLGCPAVTVRTRLHRGLADLRKVLEP